MAAFRENDYSPAARVVMGEATRAGITKESVGQWMNLALRARYGVKPNEESEIAALRRAIEIHETWGARHLNYAMDTRPGGTLDMASRRLAELEAL